MPAKKFLIVDDDERLARLVSKKLADYANCTIALGGEEAILQFEHHLREKPPFEAVIMDIEMPGMNGHQVVEKLRAIEKKNNVDPLKTFKLIMLTAHKDVKNVSQSFFRGQADAYIHKDGLAEKFIEELQKINLI